MTVDFDLNLAPQVVGVVPQPISRVGSVLTQARNQIVVYFNNDDLDPVLAEDPSFYQLIFTGHTNEFDAAFDTVTSTDDGPAILPTSVRYNATTDTATLTFSEDLSAFGVGTYRLRIGTSESVPAPPVRMTPAEDPGSSFATADTSLGDVTNTSAIIYGERDRTPLQHRVSRFELRSRPSTSQYASWINTSPTMAQTSSMV